MNTRIRKRLVQGIGVNDSDYCVDKGHIEIDHNGCRKKVFDFRCPYHAMWVEMLRRCYSETFAKQNPTYLNVEVCSKWVKSFMAFREWCLTKESELSFKVGDGTLYLDKDIIVQGSKLYSPDTCTFVTRDVNNLFLTRSNARGDYPLGVYLHINGSYVAQCQFGTGSQNYLGSGSCAVEMHRLWQKRKLQHILEVAERPENRHVCDFILLRAEQLQFDIDNKRETFHL